ncbi:hypothetical protein [Pseudoalteromonas sp. MTN2-4]|uniref:hypothetical protein n=1 Tax=Pseudoalteromonas sp. MTN2-4 TaxID=3056555 RepID=UPI0036F3F2D3
MFKKLTIASLAVLSLSTFAATDSNTQAQFTKAPTVETAKQTSLSADWFWKDGEICWVDQGGNIDCWTPPF